MARAAAELSELISASTALTVSAVALNASESATSHDASVVRSHCARLQAALAAATSPSSALAAALARPRVGVGVVLRTSCGCPVHVGRLLAGARLGSHGAGRWALPGGHLEPGETWAETASRELEEEAGLRIPAVRFSQLLVTNDIMASENLHYITIFMRAEISHEEALNVRNLEADKCAGWEWLAAPELARRPLFLALENALREGGERLLPELPAA